MAVINNAFPDRTKKAYGLRIFIRYSEVLLIYETLIKKYGPPLFPVQPNADASGGLHLIGLSLSVATTQKGCCLENFGLFTHNFPIRTPRTVT